MTGENLIGIPSLAEQQASASARVGLAAASTSDVGDAHADEATDSIVELANALSITMRTGISKKR